MSRVSGDTVAIHFVSTYRYHLRSYQDRSLHDDPPVAVRAKPAKRLTAWGMFWSDAKARLGW
jgi:hypothetical protein